jgi:hypothetical protein
VNAVVVKSSPAGVEVERCARYDDDLQWYVFKDAAANPDVATVILLDGRLKHAWNCAGLTSAQISRMHIAARRAGVFG